MKDLMKALFDLISMLRFAFYHGRLRLKDAYKRGPVIRIISSVLLYTPPPLMNSEIQTFSKGKAKEPAQTSSSIHSLVGEG